MQQNKRYVGNFPYSVDEAQLRELHIRLRNPQPV